MFIDQIEIWIKVKACLFQSESKHFFYYSWRNINLELTAIKKLIMNSKGIY